MNNLIKVTRGGQVTLPSAMRQAAGIEVGDYLEVSLEDGQMVLHPKQIIDKDQAYFWTKDWQESELEVAEDIKAGRMERFETMDDLIADLDSET
jgi:AbrB family looped-hinge helix DNA binding protein